jgi:predicted transcriptional regulator of viral defense system
MTELSTLAEVSERLPHAVIRLLSALQVHGMTTEAPHAVWLLIHRHARLPKVTSPTLEVVRASGEALVHGVETKVIDGVRVQLTTPAKTIADRSRFRRHVGLEVALAALKDYLRNREGSIDALVESARADRIRAFMRPYLEALA